MPGHSQILRPRGSATVEVRGTYDPAMVGVWRFDHIVMAVDSGRSLDAKPGSGTSGIRPPGRREWQRPAQRLQVLAVENVSARRGLDYEEW